MAIVGGDQGHRKQGQQFGDVEDSWQIVGGPLNVQSTEHFRKMASLRSHVGVLAGLVVLWAGGQFWVCLCHIDVLGDHFHIAV